MRDPDPARWTTAELQDTRRDLLASCRLAGPYSHLAVAAVVLIKEIDAELARRPDTSPEQAGGAGNAGNRPLPAGRCRADDRNRTDPGMGPACTEDSERTRSAANR